ncbi:ABC transporter permease [Nonomuraea dietziae]|uniref:ABC-2 type transport system permease protein n=1 Tax=Nonomuraea dietziae TaxID=65515 RepID=A0A7W5Y8I0_9ACTN|nr:ABC transporter permease [Nonomuraea dietziae]MBB3728616.1 ABC-2 type transport system permease protein [Nonomuraea dietziae]
MSEIYDIGYRHYEGPRLGRAHAVRALITQNLRSIFGLGRRARSKLMPFLLAASMLLLPVVSIAMMAMLGRNDIGYTNYPVIMQAVIAIFLASQSPTITAPDLRFKVLPLYLSRPVSTLDYVAAKVVAMATALFALVALPLTVMYAGELLVDPPGPPHTKEYVAGLVTALLLALLLSTFGLALASFTPRRGLGVASVIAVYLLASAVSTVLFATFESMGRADVAQWAWLVNPFFLVDSVQSWLFGTTPANGYTYPAGVFSALLLAALLGLSLTAFILRYRKAASR